MIPRLVPWRHGRYRDTAVTLVNNLMRLNVTGIVVSRYHGVVIPNIDWKAQEFSADRTLCKILFFSLFL